MIKLYISYIFLFANLVLLGFFNAGHVDFSVFFSFVILLSILYFLHLPYRLHFYAITPYLVCATFGTLLFSSYEMISGNIFYPGGDAERYYDRIVAIAQGDSSQLWGRYKFFLWVGSSWYKIVNLFTDSYSPIHLFLVSSFTVGLSGPALYLVTSKLTNRDIAESAFLLWCFTPFLWGLGFNSLRDVYVYWAVFYFVYTCVSFFQGGKSRYIIVASGLLIYIANIRFDAAIFCFIFASLYFLLDSKSAISTKLISLMVSAMLIPIVYNYNLIAIFNFESSLSLVYQADAYGAVRSMESSDGSLVASLQGSILGYFVLPVYSLINPFPPPILFSSTNTIHEFLLSLSSVLFIFALPFCFTGLSRFTKDNNQVVGFSLIISSVFLLIIFSFTSMGPVRHKLYLYGFLYIFLFYRFHNQKPYISRFELLCYIMYVFIFLFYLAVRYL